MLLQLHPALSFDTTQAGMCASVSPSHSDAIFIIASSEILS